MDEAGGCVVGIDVSKSRLDVAVLPGGEVLQLANDAAGWRELGRRLRGRAVKAIGLEPSGGYERDLLWALRQAGLPVRVLNPHRVRQYARALGRLAKNDRIDALMIARFTGDLPVRAPRHDPLAEQMAELVTARRQLSDDKVRLGNQLEQVRDPVLRRMLGCRLRRLAAEILLLDKRLAAIIAANPDLAAKDRLIQSVPGAGPAYSYTLLALVPEIADANRRELAALIGLAPFDDDSGKRKGKRRIKGGRSEVRRVAYMAALSAATWCPPLKAYRLRLIASGIAPKAAIIAVARRMIGIVAAILRSGTPFNPAHP